MNSKNVQALILVVRQTMDFLRSPQMKGVKQDLLYFKLRDAIAKVEEE